MTWWGRVKKEWRMARVWHVCDKFSSSTGFLERPRTTISPRSERFHNGLYFEEVFLIKSNALSFDERLRNLTAFILCGISQTNLGWISCAPENKALVARALIKSSRDPVFIELVLRVPQSVMNWRLHRNFTHSGNDSWTLYPGSRIM